MRLALRSAQLNLAIRVRPTEAKAIVDAIRKEAIYIWSDRWLPRLVEKYCEIEGLETGDKPEPINRNASISRVFETGKTTVQTARRLAAATKAELQLLSRKESVVEFSLEAIKQEAIAIWGEDDWLVQIVREYCQVEGRVKGEEPVPAKSRRTTIERAFKEGGTTLDTALLLVAAVGAEPQMTIHRVEVKKF